MSEVTRRRCANCTSFGAPPGVACTNAVAFVGSDGSLVAATANDVCDEHITDLEAQHAEYEHAARLQASIATLIGVGG